MGLTHPTQLSNIPTTQMRGPMGHGRGDTPTPWGSLKVRGLALLTLQPAQVSGAGPKAGRGAEATPLTMHSTSQGAVGQNRTKTAEPEGCAPGTAL